MSAPAPVVPKRARLRVPSVREPWRCRVGVRGVCCGGFTDGHTSCVWFADAVLCATAPPFMRHNGAAADQGTPPGVQDAECTPCVLHRIRCGAHLTLAVSQMAVCSRVSQVGHIKKFLYLKLSQPEEGFSISVFSPSGELTCPDVLTLQELYEVRACAAALRAVQCKCGSPLWHVPCFVPWCSAEVLGRGHGQAGVTVLVRPFQASVRSSPRASGRSHVATSAPLGVFPAPQPTNMHTH